MITFTNVFTYNVARMQINRLSVCKNKDNNIHCSDLLKKSFREDLGKMLC